MWCGEEIPTQITARISKITPKCGFHALWVFNPKMENLSSFRKCRITHHFDYFKGNMPEWIKRLSLYSNDTLLKTWFLFLKFNVIPLLRQRFEGNSTFVAPSFGKSFCHSQVTQLSFIEEEVCQIGTYVVDIFKLNKNT